MELKQFSHEEIQIVNNAVALAEELVINFYKISINQQVKYDIKTVADLSPNEIAHGPFAQIIRYSGQRKDRVLGSSAYDFYKICVQDHAILAIAKHENNQNGFLLFPLILYIITHELVHIIRFSRFLQNFEATEEEKLLEEKRVHAKTREILKDVDIVGLKDVFIYICP
ncbi:MAG: hypothetical protein HQK78_00700 [Desulfobacterales bacterium]|nr:hypothetical protein [Desulfobacterales bacterium]